MKGSESRDRILIVDDEPGIARMIQVFLESWGFSTLVAHSGQEALELISHRPVDLVLLDIMMAGFDGYAVLRALRGDGRFQQLPVILVTAKDAVRDKVEGLELGADDHITKPFNNEELLARIKAQLRIRRMGRELLRRNRELTAFNAIAAAVNRSLELSEILNSALDTALEVLGAEGGIIRLLEEATGELYLAAHRGRSELYLRERARVKPEDTMLVLLKEKGEAVVIADLRERLEPFFQWPKAEGYRAYAGIPLLARNRMVGILAVLSRIPGRFKPEDVRFLTAIGHQIGLSIENARLFKRAGEQVERMRTVHDVSLSLNSSLDLDRVLRVFIERLIEVTGAKRCMVDLLSEGSEIGRLQVGYDGLRKDPWISGIDLSLEKYPEIMEVIRSRRPLLIQDAMREPLLHSFREILAPLNLSAILVIPLLFRSQVIGVLSLSHVGKGRAFSEAEVDFCQTLAAQVAVSIENARLFEERSRLAITDELTGLYNHRHFYRVLQAEVNRALRYRRHLSMIMLDIDHFKRYNDRWGHLAGDEALRGMAGILRRNARDVDTIARYGGEEFAIILPETEPRQATIQAERIRAAVERHSFREPLTISLGVAAFAKGMQKGEELVQEADRALYRAKAEGKNRVCLAQQPG